MKTLIAILLLASPAAAQTVSSIEPASGPTRGGTFVHIRGTDLIGFALLCPALECSDYVQFGGTLADIAVHTTTEIVAIAPAHAAGTVDVTVNVAGKAKITIPAAFRYEAPAADDVEKILIPIIPNGASVPGAFGSIWKSEVIVHNASSDDLSIAQYCNPIVLTPCPAPVSVPKGSTVTPTLYGAGPGIFVFIPRRNVSDIDIALRIQDISRQSETWGTAIPVVRANDFRSIVRLNGVPTDSRFRDTLRLYGYSGMSDPITIRIFDPASPQALVEGNFSLRASTDLLFPSYLDINGLTDTFPAIRGRDTVRVEVTSASTPPKPIWAFVSVTNNETQHVTAIAPSP
jgi:hypothetical protein